MNRIAAVILLAFAVLGGGCAQQLQELKNVYSIATNTTVTPASLLVVANSFDTYEGTATQYLIYCKTHLSSAACSADNRRATIKYTRAGRAARNQAETYITSNTNAPSVIYNSLAAAVNNLSTGPASKGANQ